MDGGEADLARRAWRAMSDVVLDHDRKVAVSNALGLSWTRVLALRRLAPSRSRCAVSPSGSPPTRRTSR